MGRKFNQQIDTNKQGSTWWTMIIELTNTVTVDMVEAKFGVVRQDDKETIFDLVMRTGLAPTFQGAVALLTNTFPPPPPPEVPLWKKILNMIPSFKEQEYK